MRVFRIDQFDLRDVVVEIKIPSRRIVLFNAEDFVMTAAAEAARNDRHIAAVLRQRLFGIGIDRVELQVVVEQIREIGFVAQGGPDRVRVGTKYDIGRILDEVDLRALVGDEQFGAVGERVGRARIKVHERLRLDLKRCALVGVARKLQLTAEAFVHRGHVVAQAAEVNVAAVKSKRSDVLVDVAVDLVINRAHVEVAVFFNRNSRIHRRKLIGRVVSLCVAVVGIGKRVATVLKHDVAREPGSLIVGEAEHLLVRLCRPREIDHHVARSRHRIGDLRYNAARAARGVNRSDNFERAAGGNLGVPRAERSGVAGRKDGSRLDARYTGEPAVGAFDCELCSVARNGKFAAALAERIVAGNDVVILAAHNRENRAGAFTGTSNEVEGRTRLNVEAVDRLFAEDRCRSTTHDAGGAFEAQFGRFAERMSGRTGNKRRTRSHGRAARVVAVLIDERDFAFGDAQIARALHCGRELIVVFVGARARKLKRLAVVDRDLGETVGELQTGTGAVLVEDKLVVVGAGGNFFAVGGVANGNVELVAFNIIAVGLEIEVGRIAQNLTRNERREYRAAVLTGQILCGERTIDEIALRIFDIRSVGVIVDIEVNGHIALKRQRAAAAKIDARDFAFARCARRAVVKGHRAAAVERDVRDGARNGVGDIDPRAGVGNKARAAIEGVAVRVKVERDVVEFERAVDVGVFKGERAARSRFEADLAGAADGKTVADRGAAFDREAGRRTAPNGDIAREVGAGQNIGVRKGDIGARSHVDVGELAARDRIADRAVRFASRNRERRHTTGEFDGTVAERELVADRHAAAERPVSVQVSVGAVDDRRTVDSKIGLVRALKRIVAERKERVHRLVVPRKVNGAARVYAKRCGIAEARVGIEDNLSIPSEPGLARVSIFIPCKRYRALAVGALEDDVAGRAAVLTVLDECVKDGCRVRCRIGRDGKTLPARIFSVVAAADIAGFVEQTKIGDLVADRKRAGLAVVREVLVVRANGFGNTPVFGAAVCQDDFLLNFLRGPVRRTFGVEIVAIDNLRTAHGFGFIAVHKNEIADAGDDSDVRADRAGVENFGAAVGNPDGIVRRAEDNGGLPVTSSSRSALERQSA